MDPQAPETADLITALWNALDEEGGAGLAAPQIGVDARVCIVAAPETRDRIRRLVLVNPERVETFDERVPFEEGCLSFPGLYFTVRRSRGVEVTYDDPARPGERQRLRDDGLAARIVQHEMDHLDGVLFIDHLSGRQRLARLPRLLWILLRGLLRA